MRFRETSSTFGQYDLLEEIGRGGMGVIYRARDRRNGRVVAVKRLLDYQSESPQTRARFRREVQISAALSHPHIVPIYEISETRDGVPFFAMKLAKRGSLAQHRAEFREPKRAVRLVAAVARAVDHAHRRGVLHRDLKPSNILLDDNDAPHVSDFGLAKWLDDAPDLTQTLTVFGTPGYIAPEQAIGSSKAVREAADVYSLGAILFELIAGRPPFLGEHALAVLHQALQKPAPRLRKIMKAADRRLETICARCLQREPADRYASAEELAEDLDRWLDGKRLAAVRSPHVAKAWRLARGKPSRLVSITLSAVIAILALSALCEYLIARQRESTATAKPVVALLPIFDLDAAAFDDRVTASAANQITAASAQLPITIFAASIADPAEVVGQASRRGSHVIALIEPTRRRVGDHWRLALPLIDADSKRLLSQTEMDLPSDGRPDLHAWEKYAASAAAALNASRDGSHLRDDLPADDVARNAIVTARQLVRRYSTPEIDRAIDLLRVALQRAPDSALAHAYLAEAAAARAHYVADERSLDLAAEHAERAIELRPTLGESHRARASVHFVSGDFHAALEELLRQAELEGVENTVSDFIAAAADMLGRPDQALRWCRVGQQWESRPGEVYAQMADCWARLGEDDKADTTYRKAAAMHPNIQIGWIGLCHLRLLQGNIAAARTLLVQHIAGGSTNETDQLAAQIELFGRNFAAAAERYVALAQLDGNGGGTFYGNVDYRSAIARCQQALGEADSATQILHDCLNREMALLRRAPHNPQTLYRLAAVQSCLGDSAKSLEYLRAAGANGWIDWRSADVDPRFDTVRTLPLFQELRENVRRRTAEMQRNLSPNFDVKL